ncbi:hypothetical protein COO91_01879 [Nostoc flagelliforme CCNUN1]|uniref:Uncharacterized protein n=1 Tax=Nostoc flagelliforme CCNUN1 TaxID=2038116 RepID=A0A2K8SKG1_9NOSO|nr:hypothetical protein [Nostoc flagelliforme]AUB35986.1 hypothetical protein COO91_01879 [Nostoc flagelliforme CCNUN1]
MNNNSTTFQKNSSEYNPRYVYKAFLEEMIGDHFGRAIALQLVIN